LRHLQTGNTLLDWLGSHQGKPLGCQEVWDWAQTYGAFLGKYRLIGLVVHSSGTCLVIFAEEISTGNLVALKLMHNKEEWLREQRMRMLSEGLKRELDQIGDNLEDSGDTTNQLLHQLYGREPRETPQTNGNRDYLDSKHIVPLMSAEVLKEDAGTMDIRLKGENQKCFLLVMPQAKHDLSDVLSHSRFAGRDRTEVIKILAQVVDHLQYLNEGCNRLHGDLKPRNLIQLEITADNGVTVLVWVLIDLDASCEIGSPAGQKITSSAYYPPEMARQELAKSATDNADSDSSQNSRKIELEQIIDEKRANLNELRSKSLDTEDEEMALLHELKILKAELNHTGSAEPVKASVGFEMWYFGCLLYQLCTLDGATLWDANQADNIDEDQLRQLAYQWPQIKASKMKKIVWPEAKALAEWLLQEDVNDRPQAWDQVLQHPFIAGESIMDKLNEIGRDVQAIGKQLDKVQAGVEVVRKTIVNLDKSPVPTMFIIEPHSKLAGEIQADMNTGEIDAAATKVSGFFAPFKQIFAAAGPGGSKETVLEAVESAIQSNVFDEQKLVLRLVCQYTWEPVGDGYEVTAPREFIPKVLPLMSAGLKGMKAVNGAASLGRMFGLPVPKIPDEFMSKAEEIVSGLSGESDFECIAQAAGQEIKGTSASSRKTSLSRFQQREFAEFLTKHDPKAKWKDVLVRVALEDGAVLWVSKDAHDQLQQEDQLQAEDRLPPMDMEILPEKERPNVENDSTALAARTTEPAFARNGLRTPISPSAAGVPVSQDGSELRDMMALMSRQMDQQAQLINMLVTDHPLGNAAARPRLSEAGRTFTETSSRPAGAIRPVTAAGTEEEADEISAAEPVDGASQSPDAFADPEGWAKKKLMDKAMTTVRKILEPKLEDNGLVWEDVLPMLEHMDTVDELMDAVRNPEAFIEQLMKDSGPLAKKIALSKLRSKLEPKVQETYGLSWDDVVPTLALLDTVTELEQAFKEPESFLEGLLETAGPVGKTLALKIALSKVRPELEPALEQRGLSWKYALSIMDAIEGHGVEELGALLEDPSSTDGGLPQLIEKLLQYDSVAALRRLQQESRVEENRMHDRADSKACVIS
jgi:serine/threonine protein kinase